MEKLPEGVDIDFYAQDLEQRDANDNADDVELDGENVASAANSGIYPSLAGIEARAATKTKAPSKLKMTKTSLPKTKTTKMKTTTKAIKTKTKAVKTKTTARVTTSKHAKTTKAKATTKPTKTAKVPKPPKASQTAKTTGAAKSNSCPIKKPTKKPTKKPRAFAARAYDYIAHLFTRADREPEPGDFDREFIGWHGTNSETAALWKAKGYIEKPVKTTGILDFISLGTTVTAGTSGANSEIGKGLYVSDTRETSIHSGIINAQHNPGTMPSVCAIYARSSGNWRNVVRKVFLPEPIVGDTPHKEKLRVAHIKQVVQGVSEHTVVRLALFDRRENKLTGQMLIPESIANQFTATCFKVEGQAVAPSDAAASEVGTKNYPAFSFNGATLRRDWKIVPENPRSGNTASGSGNTPSGSGNTPSGSGNTPSGSGNTPSGSGDAPSTSGSGSVEGCS